MTISIDQMLGIDRADPMQQRATKQVRADWALIRELVAARERAGLTQAEVARLMGISQSAVARIESGARDPHLSTLRRYAVAVGVTVEHVLEHPSRARSDARPYLPRVALDRDDEAFDWSGSIAELAQAAGRFGRAER